MDWTLTGLLLALAFGANLPLGWWRRYQRRFSPAWFLGIHASIPVFIAPRFAFGISYWVIPFEIAAVVAGQVGGPVPATMGSRRDDDESHDPR